MARLCKGSDTVPPPFIYPNLFIIPSRDFSIFFVIINGKPVN